uniref:Uncharacterized protein n=1 Tax=Geobacter sp. (strain M21) TaxID=443144 RepID=C6E6T7_GEOSM
MKTVIVFLAGYGLGAAVATFLMLCLKPTDRRKTDNGKGGYYHV